MSFGRIRMNSTAPEARGQQRASLTGLLVASIPTRNTPEDPMLKAATRLDHLSRSPGQKQRETKAAQDGPGALPYAAYHVGLLQ
jgi:hypothetical protein